MCVVSMQCWCGDDGGVSVLVCARCVGTDAAGEGFRFRFRFSTSLFNLDITADETISKPPNHPLRRHTLGSSFIAPTEWGDTITKLQADSLPTQDKDGLTRIQPQQFPSSSRTRSSEADDVESPPISRHHNSSLILLSCHRCSSFSSIAFDSHMFTGEFTWFRFGSLTPDR